MPKLKPAVRHATERRKGRSTEVDTTSTVYDAKGARSAISDYHACMILMGCDVASAGTASDR